MPVSFDNIMSASKNQVSQSSALHMSTPVPAPTTAPTI